MAQDLLSLSRDELAQVLASWGEPEFRSAQIFDWVWKRWVTDFAAMTNLPLALRTRLDQTFTPAPLTPLAHQVDEEATEKVLLGLADGEAIEAVLMREGDRRTVCLSTQVGCPVGCAFCATGQSKFKRNLTAGEIAGQVLHFARRLAPSERVTHVVVMGMGEPLFNYAATIKAVRILNDPQGMGLGARRFTISTVGVVPGILRLAQEGLQVNLAISLHAPEDRLREKLVPTGQKWTIGEILEAGDAYAQATGRRVSYEYVLLGGVNDGLAQARALAELLRGRLAHVNLIPFNPAPGLPFAPPSPGQVDAFRRELVNHGVDATVRRSRGTRILAGCGQLRGLSTAQQN